MAAICSKYRHASTILKYISEIRVAIAGPTRGRIPPSGHKRSRPRELRGHLGFLRGNGVPQRVRPLWALPQPRRGACHIATRRKSKRSEDLAMAGPWTRRRPNPFLFFLLCRWSPIGAIERRFNRPVRGSKAKEEKCALGLPLPRARAPGLQASAPGGAGRRDAIYRVRPLWALPQCVGWSPRRPPAFDLPLAALRTRTVPRGCRAPTLHGFDRFRAWPL